ncbi:phage tail family protein [Clostridium botulinum]|uniref:phage tail family protein n=1 Tax=Clostridium botulinum TaxID=1491 RepID=UPI0007745476|nr:phage tail family protein [Clostridium botulinum]APH22973.1 phage tail family protein [Clostridium botulinum]MBN3372157.1 phage tail family protein [Clostridium botulinum]MBN3375953.1 phage tail family protein [Clostridium botulinum]MBN3380536.1 phage tail family protein [Clostridium botulinum]MBN3448284.1 phage tail family protein [Clostridium botulinum]
MQKLNIINSNGKELILSSSKPFIFISIGNNANNSANIYSSSGAGQDGISIDAITLKERLLPIVGGILGESKEDLHRKRAFLSSFFNPRDKLSITYKDDAKTRKIFGIVQDITFNDVVGVTQEFLVQVLCPNPYWRELEEYKTTIALWEGDFEFPLEIQAEGIEMGHRVSNLICNIANKGDVKCGMRIQFKALATVVNPSLFNINTREFIKINRSLNAGDVLEVTTEINNKRIELIKSNGTKENVFYWLDLESDFVQLDKGDNLFRYDAEKGIDNLEVAIYHTPLYLGV